MYPEIIDIDRTVADNKYHLLSYMTAYKGFHKNTLMEDSMTTILEINNLSYTIILNKKKKIILDNISLAIQKGDFITIKGASGSGKSTLLQLIGSMIEPSSGEIKYQGKPLKEYLVTDYRKEVSYGFQNASLFGETVRENLAFPFDIRNEPFDEKRAIDALHTVSLNEDYLDQPVKALSGGEKQRIAFIRNILFLPKVLLLDEVTSALDEVNRIIIRKAVRRLNEEHGITIIWVTHNTEEIAASKNVIEISGGQLNE